MALFARWHIFSQCNELIEQHIYRTDNIIVIDEMVTMATKTIWKQRIPPMPENSRRPVFNNVMLYECNELLEQHVYRTDGRVNPFHTRSVNIQSSHFTRAPNVTVLQNIYTVDIVSWLAKSAEHIINIYKHGINL